jgi:hypothetical protein
VVGFDARQSGTTLDRLEHDPFLDALTPHIFEADGAGALLAPFGFERERAGYAAENMGSRALARLAEQGRLDRTMLLDGCLSRFLKGERPGSLRAFVELHNDLAPTLDETTARSSVYLRLLPDAHSTVAALAQGALRRLDDAGRLDRAQLLEAGRSVLFRAEKGMVKTQLSWLDSAARRDRAEAGQIVSLLTVAFGHPAIDVQERALTLAERYRDQCDPSVRASLAEATSRLSADLAVRGQASFGSVSASAMVADRLPPPATAPAPVPRAMPAAIASVHELAAELSGLTASAPDPVAWERVLEALVRFNTTDRSALRESLTPLVQRWQPEHERGGPSSVGLSTVLLRVLAALAREEPGSRWRAFTEAVRGVVDRLDGPELVTVRGMPAPHMMMVWRLGEIAQRRDREPGPGLVSTPTTVTGHIGPMVLVDRLAAAEREGWTPWPVDLAQALLRLPRSVPADAVAAAGRLTSSAGQALSGWLAPGGRPDPTAEIVVRPWFGRWPNEVRRNNAPASRLIVRLVRDPSTPGPVIDRPLHYDPSNFDRWKIVDSQPMWPAVLPSHPEVIAAHLLTAVTLGLGVGRTPMRMVLPGLAESDGPLGPAMWLLLARAMGSDHADDRVAAVDAVIILDRAGDLDGPALGTLLGRVAADGDLTLTRVVPVLADLAEAGPAAPTLAILEAALPAILASPKPPAGTPDLLALASRLATTLGVRRSIAGLAELAARSGTSRLVTEARRLQRVLSGVSAS